MIRDRYLRPRIASQDIGKPDIIHADHGSGAFGPSRVYMAISLLCVMLVFCLPAEARVTRNYTYNPNHFDAVKTIEAMQHPHSDLVIISAHRGLHSVPGDSTTVPGVPENSLASVAAAAQAGLEVLELDAKQTSDRQITFSHDKVWGRQAMPVGGGTSFSPFNPVSPGDPLNPVVADTSLETLQSNWVLRDSVSFLYPTNPEPPPTLQDVINFYNANQIQTVLAFDIKDAPTFHLVWNQIKAATDFLGRPFRQDVVFKISGNLYPTPQDFHNDFGLDAPYINMIWIYNTSDIDPSKYGSEQAIINSLASFYADTTLSTITAEITQKQPGGILDTMRADNIAAGRSVAEFSPTGDYFFPNNPTAQFYSSADGSCCQTLNLFYYTFPGGTPADTADDRGDLSFVLNEKFNMITADTAQSWASQLASDGLRNLSYIQDAGFPGPPNCNRGTAYPGCDDANNPGTTVYTYCVAEGGTCSFSGARNIAFGANGEYKTYYALNSATCNNATLGPDPAPGVVKACYYGPAIPDQVYAPDFIYCADEHGVCSFSSAASAPDLAGYGYVSFGAIKSTTLIGPWGGSTDCTVEAIDTPLDYPDPAPGFVKTCHYQQPHSSAGYGAGPAGYELCSQENQICTFAGAARIAFGANGAFSYRTFATSSAESITGGVGCNDSNFRDPLDGVVKSCYYQYATPAGALINPPGGNQPSGTSLTCDLYASGGTPCVAAHSMVRALFGGYGGRLYQVKRASDGKTSDIGTLSTGGYVNAAAQDTFCGGTTCTITMIYDQTSNHNDLPVTVNDSPAVANALPITVNGNEAYGLKVTPGVGYRNNATHGVATNGSPEGMYMVTSGTFVNNACCFDYGNAEPSATDTGAGHMDAINFGTYCEVEPCNGSGPWVEADLENGQYMGNGVNANPNDVSMPYNFVTAMLKNNGQSTFALKGGDAQSGGLTTDYSGTLPTVTVGGMTYIPMKQEGAIILGTGGDNSDRDQGSFFEGAMTSGYPSDEIESEVQANIVAAGYAGDSSGGGSGGSGVSEPAGPYTGPSDPGGPGPQDGFASPAAEQPNDVMATKPALASFNGNLYVAFQGVNVNNDLYVTSSPTGNNFPMATQYTNLQSTSAPALATYNNQLYMAFRGLNVDNDFYITSSPTGTNFPTATRYTNIQMGGAPALAVFNNQLCAAFQANDTGHTLHITCSSDGVTWPTAWQITNVAIGSDPAMAVFNGILYVAFRANDPSNDVWIASSSDGVNFSSQKLSGQTMGGSSSPALVVSNGVLYYIYAAFDQGHEMLVSASTDGSTWQGPAAYLGVQTGATGPAAAAFANGVTVGFQSNDSRNVLFVTNKVTEAASYTGTNDPGGPGPQDGFSSPAVEQPNEVMATRPALASFNQSLYVAFQGVNVNNDLYVTSSSTGNNFPMATQYTNLQSSSAPALAAFNNQLFMAFRGMNVNNDFYVTSSSTGSNFPTATRYTNIQMGGAPALAVFNNQLCAAFKAVDPGHTLHVACSSDGVTWPAAWQVANVAIGSDPAMAVFNGVLYVAFRANDTSNDVWIASSSDGHTFSSQVLTGQTMEWASSPALVASHGVLYYIYAANDQAHEMLVTASTDGTTWQGPAAYLGNQMGALGPGAAEFGDGVYVGFQSNDSRNVLFVTNKVTGAPVFPEQPQPPTTTNPQPGAFMNDAALLGNANDPNWFLSNIPFLEVPDTAIQQVYYYRWQTYKEHLVYTSPFYGWLSTEFLTPASYGAPYGGINAAAGHQTTEGRWLRNQQYVDNNIDYWLNGPGQQSKPQDYDHNPDTTDWAHEYSYWAASSVWQTYLATGDAAFATGHLSQLVTQYRGWDNHFNSSLGLYWQYPVWDASEYTPASYESTDPYHGGAGYRPTINSYQFGDAQAIANIANLPGGNSAIASEYTQRANALQAATQKYLWDPNRKFFYHMNRDNNPTNALLDTREEEGFVPWMFELPTASDSSAMAELLDPSGFLSAYGPPTAEKRSSWYMYQASGCCHWDGPSWPYETSQTLTGLANLLIDYPEQQYVDASDYVSLLHTYAATQYKGGSPYVAEAHDPDNNNWIYDTPNHSEDYNHSTYIDNVISGLIGLRGQPDNSIVIAPLAPSSWDYFALENTPYHGHNLTVLWDRLGTRYGQGTGLSVFVDNKKVVSQNSLVPVKISVGSTLASAGDGLFNVAVNSQHTAYGPQPIASYVFSPVDNIFNGIDGIVYRTGIPENSRWTTYLSPNPSDYYGVNFRRNVTIQEIDVNFYDDGGGTRVPLAADLQYMNATGVWTTLGTIGTPQPNTMISLKFSPITTTQIRVLASNASSTQGWGISELQAMSTSPGVTSVSTGVYQIVNVNSGKLMGVHNEYPFAGAQIQQYEDDKTPDHFWIVQDQGNGYFTIQNLASQLLLGVDQESTADSALVKQAYDNGSADHFWRFTSQNGAFKIQNKNSGLLLAVDQESTANSANIVQYQDNGTPDHLWVMNQVTDPRAIPVYRYMNYNSGKVLAVQDESQADGAQIQQYDDNLTAANSYLTPDHLWEKDDLGGGFFMLRNVLSNLVLGVNQESTANSALIKQAQNNGTPDHKWEFFPDLQVTSPNGVAGGIQCYKVQNFNSGLFLGVDQESSADNANVVQFQDNGTPDHQWCEFAGFADPRNKPVYKIANVNSGLVLAVQNMSTAPGVQIQQYSDSGTNDHIWQLEDAGGGYFKILNLRSNLVLGIDQESTANSALIKQAVDNGTPDHLWQFVPVGNDQFKIQNKLSGLLLGVDAESTATSANIVQFQDNGTNDHLWLMEATAWPTLFP